MEKDGPLDQILQLYLRDLYAEITSGCVVIGIQVFMCTYALWVLLGIPKQRRIGRERYMVISLIMLILDCIAVFPHAPYTYKLLRLPNNTPNYTVELYKLIMQLDFSPSMILAECSNTLLVWVGDGLLVYRCYIIWADKQYVTLLPAATYLGHIGCSIAVITIRYSRHVRIPSLERAWFLMSVITNCSVTLLIGGRLLYLRNQLASVSKEFNAKAYTNASSIVAESALPFAIVCLGYAICMHEDGKGPHWRSWTMAAHTFLFLSNFLAALAPQFIIFRVVVGMSFTRHNELTSTSTTLKFQPPGRRPTISTESYGGPQGSHSIPDSDMVLKQPWSEDTP